MRDLVQALGQQGEQAREGRYAGIWGATAITTDGVGSKASLAVTLDHYEGLGQDCLAMVVNDLLCVGAIPEVVVDYVVLPSEDPDLSRRLGKGLGEAAERAEVEIVGGETAILSGGYFDLAATAIGQITAPHLVDNTRLRSGDVLVGLPSSGLHANGIGTAMSILPRERWPVLLEPTRLYVEVESVFHLLTALAHITGGGWSNLERMARGKALQFKVTDPLPRPNVFEGLPVNRAIWNEGLGMALCCHGRDLPEVLRLLPESQQIGVVRSQLPTPTLTDKS